MSKNPSASKAVRLTISLMLSCVLLSSQFASIALASANTPVMIPPDIVVQDAQLAEPATGSANMFFSVSLSTPAPAGGVSVDFTTGQQPPGIGRATAGSDYTTTSGTINFAMGEQLKVISVPVLADATNEVNETFLVILLNPVNGAITDGTATGTIGTTNPNGLLLISELRTSGPDGAGDDFVEIYNNSSSPHTVAAPDGTAGYGLFRMGATCGAAPELIGIILNDTVIPARGHFLFVGSFYSLRDNTGGDQAMISDIQNDGNVGLFSTSSLANISTANRFDAVGFGANTGGNCDLLREGTTLPALSGSVLEHTYYRDECGNSGNPATFGACPTGGATKDTNVNANDFIFADTTGSSTAAGQRLGAPGPEGLVDPVVINANIGAVLLDGTKAAATAPNRVRDFTSDPANNSTFGTISARRRWINNTGAPITRLRFRMVDISTFPAPSGVADLRMRTSGLVVVAGVTDSATCLASTGSAATPCTINLHGTTLETPPAQPKGGANNSTFAAGTITIGTPLPAGASINLQFLWGVQATGSFKYYVNVEGQP